jgi:hypothetical protein
VEHKRPSAQVSIADIGGFLFGTSRGRILASAFLAAAALLGLVLGVLHASNTVMVVSVVVFAEIMVPIILLQAIKATRPPHDGQQ